MNNQYNLYSEQLVAAASISNDSNELAERTSLDLSSEYITNSNSNVHIVNYLSLPNSELLQQQHQPCDGSKQIESSFMHAKSQTHMLAHTHKHAGSGADIFSSYDLPVLTPLKYVEYNGGAEEQIIMSSNDDICDDVNEEDCVQDFKEMPVKNAKRSLPHKKRIAKKLNSEFSIILSSSSGDDSAAAAAAAAAATAAITSVNVSQDPQFECTECGLTIVGQLDFYIHLKEHYEGQHTILKQAKRKRIMDESVEDMSMHVEEDDPNSVPENLLIETLEDSQDDDIKTEEIEADAFEFSETEEDMEDMEDFRKEVEKVVETIADAECMPDATWNYQVSDEIEENHSNVAMIESFPEKLETICTQQEGKDCTMMDAHYVGEKYDSNSCGVMFAENDGAISSGIEHVEQQLQQQQQQQEEEEEDIDEEDEDNKPLEEVRVMLKRSRRDNSEREKTQNDKDELELNECLKRIHNFSCKDCNKAFNSRTALGYHLKTHNSERRYVCEQCGKKFLTNGALKVHLRLHTDERPYQCSHCNRSFRQFGDMKYHETSIHSNKKDHVCEFCAKAFARKYSLIIHRRIHTNERNYKCNECDKSFRASSYLLNHKRIHSGEKPYSCSVCQKKFRVHGDAKRHMKIHDRVKGTKEKKSLSQNLGTHELKEDDVKQTIVVKQEEQQQDVTSKSLDNNQLTKKGKKLQKRKSVK